MKSLFSPPILILLALTLSGCRSPEAASQSQPAKQGKPAHSADRPRDSAELISEFFIKGDTVSYKGYEISKLKKEVDHREECPPGKRDNPCVIPVYYTVIKRQGKALAKFDEFYYGPGNGNEFALHPLLGGEAKQLIISQTAPRSGRHYVVDLASKPGVIFDSYDYEVGREEVEVSDLDDDGIYELSLAVTAFYLVFNVSMAETPLPQVIFKYDRKAQKYLPANHIFQTRLLGRIEEVKSLKDKDARSDVGRSLSILLDYIYAGKEEEGWAFYEREYNLADKEKVKSEIMSALRNAPAYKYIRGHRAP
jgi:hypothetical protein